MNRTDATGYRPGYNSEGYLDPTPEEAIRNMQRNGRQARALPEAKEDAEQIAVIKWAGYMTGKYPPLSRLLHIPNGGSRNRIEAAKLKRMGVRPGVPDLLLPYPISDWSGLWLEMKTEKGRPTPEQRDWIEYLRSVGYLAYICHGAGEAINALEAYLAAERKELVEKNAVPLWDSLTKYQPGTKVMYHGEEHIIGETMELKLSPNRRAEHDRN